MEQKNRFERGAKIALYLLAAFLPIFFVPLPLGVEFGREIVFNVLIIAAALLWLASVLTSGRMRWRHSPIIYAALAMLVVFGLSAAFSGSPYVSVFLADAAAEKFYALLLGVILTFLAGAVLGSREEAGTAAFLLISAAGVSGIFNLVQLVFGRSLWGYLANFASEPSFNVIGTMNGLSLFYASLLAGVLGILFSHNLGEWRKSVRLTLYAAAAVFALNVALIGHRASWIVLIAVLTILFGLTFAGAKPAGGRLKTPQVALLGFISVSIVMLIAGNPSWNRANIPLEVSPSFSSTVGVAKSVFKDGTVRALFGSGPGTFGSLWERYKAPSINRTIFWGVRFNQGFSWASTVLATTGILGFLSFLAFMISAALLFLKNILKRREEGPTVALGVFGIWSALAVAAFLYPANFSLVILFFFTLGLLSLLCCENGVKEVSEAGEFEEAAEGGAFLREEVSGRGGGFLSVRKMVLKLENPWVTFVSSLAAVFFVALCVSAFYADAGRLRAALLQSSGLKMLAVGNVDGAVAKFEAAAAAESGNFRNHQALVQLRAEKINNLISRAAAGENVQQEFQSAVSLAVRDSQTALALYPQNSFLWRTQGALYEMLIPFVAGSENFAVSSYAKAAEIDRFNPAIKVDIGRSYIALADRFQLAAGGAKENEREGVLKARAEALENAKNNLEKAAELKADLAAAHFLLAQTAIRLGDLKSAILSAENARFAAPFDVGAAFQLGLLYYQSQDWERAGAEFARAVLLDENYSNARYFLGLIYERKGDKAAALEQFEKIAKLNPENEEVKKILENLRAGRGALETIVPPAEPPEKRKEVPVKEEKVKSNEVQPR